MRPNSTPSTPLRPIRIHGHHGLSRENPAVNGAEATDRSSSAANEVTKQKCSEGLMCSPVEARGQRAGVTGLG
jgi:hypothetical protein